MPTTLTHAMVCWRSGGAFGETGADALYGDLDYVAGMGRVGWCAAGAAASGAAQFFAGVDTAASNVYGRSCTMNWRVLDLRSAADYELMLRMLHKHRAVPPTFECIGENANGRNEQRQLDKPPRANREDHAAWRMNGLRPMPWTLVIKPLRAGAVDRMTGANVLQSYFCFLCLSSKNTKKQLEFL